MNLGDWLLAVTATAAPMMIQTANDPVDALRIAGVMLVMLGNLGQAAAKLALARSFGIAPANRGIKVSGPYRLVRHPMYAGYLVVHIGVVLMMPLPINVVIYTIGWTAQIRRILAEEALLGQDPTYREYRTKVRWRMIPGVF
jgi:protein-S-isoprenylcysteine O-methyltransferase Ste14